MKRLTRSVDATTTACNCGAAMRTTMEAKCCAKSSKRAVGCHD
jgi:hypothetical protein